MGALRYLLDTNILSALAREPQGRVYQTLSERLPDTACTSIVVASEIRFGLQRGFLHHINPSLGPRRVRPVFAFFTNTATLVVVV